VWWPVGCGCGEEKVAREKCLNLGESRERLEKHTHTHITAHIFAREEVM
jgi:hypothetical protein